MEEGVTEFSPWSKVILAEEDSESLRPFLPVAYANSKTLLEKFRKLGLDRIQRSFAFERESHKKVATAPSVSRRPPTVTRLLGPSHPLRRASAKVGTRSLTLKSGGQALFSAVLLRPFFIGKKGVLAQLVERLNGIAA